MLHIILSMTVLLLIVFLMQFIKQYNLNKLKKNLEQIQEQERDYHKYLIQKHGNIKLT